MTLNTNIREEMNIFDSSLSLTDIDSVLSDDEYRDKIVSLLSPILEKRFSGNVYKQKIRVKKDRILVSCPICGDSMKSDWKQRGNIILRGKYRGFYKCFNCGSFQRIDNFLKDFNVEIDLKTLNYISNNLTDFSTTANIKYDMSVFLDMQTIENVAIDREEFRKYFDYLEVKDSRIYNWLKNRLQYDVSKFMYSEKLNHLIILNLTKSGRILGMQKRTFQGPNRYLTYKISKIYELMNKDPNILSDEIDALSQIFNICLLDYSKPIILCEGPLDSFLLKNAIANAGANKSFPFDLPLKYFYDNDETGIKKSLEKINNNEQVFLWNKFLNDVNVPFKKKWDVNDILIWSRENNVKLPSFDLYFSNDSLDSIDI